MQWKLFFTSLNLFDLNITLPVDIHIVNFFSFVIGDDVQSIPRSVESDPDRLTVSHLVCQNHHSKRVEQLSLNCSVERTSAIGGRIAARDEELFGFCVDVELHLPIREALFDLTETEIENLEHVVMGERTLGGSIIT
jgi:hypothetical protein